MIKIEKNFDSVPSLLNKQNRKDAFLQNISDKSYTDNKNWYKGGSIQKKLNNIYNTKCAYCEDRLLNAPKYIEHYRPKDRYYWLAYSWDNLLLCCSSCNSSKGTNFETKNQKVIYNNEPFEKIHNLGDDYNKLEKPMLINPEKEDVINDLTFDNNSKIYSNNERVDYTIETCKLNREELRKLREEILNDFINSVKKHYLVFITHGDITRFNPDIETLLEKSTQENKFYAFRYFILNNPEIFFDKMPLQRIVKSLILKIKSI